MSRGWDCDSDGYDTLRDLGALPMGLPARVASVLAAPSEQESAYRVKCPACGAPPYVECRGQNQAHAWRLVAAVDS